MRRGVCTITVVAEGPEEILNGRATIRVQSPYDNDFVEALKGLASYRERAWDENEKCWWFLGHHLEALTELARTFEDAWLIEGNVRINLHTGERIEQIGLFD